MRIDTLYLKNFRCFSEQQFEFHPHCNIFIGENGAGKSSVLRAVFIPSSVWIEGISGQSGVLFSDYDVRLVPLGDYDIVTFEEIYPVIVKVKGLVPSSDYLDGSEEYGWTRSRFLPPFEDLENHGVRDLVRSAAKVRRAVQAGQDIVLPIIANYSTGRLWQLPEKDADGRITDQRELSRLEGYSTRDDGNSTRQLVRWLAYQDYAAYQERRKAVVYSVVLEAMREIVEGATEVSFHPRRLEVVVTFEGGRQVPFSLLSDGQRNILALAGDIAMRMARLNPHLRENCLKETPGIVLIDELDLHLHPRWQRHIMRDLRRVFPKVQFFATTHSPQIISEIEPECITVLHREGADIFVRGVAQSYGLNSNEILEELMDVASRPEGIQAMFDQVERHIDEGELDLARKALDALRVQLHGTTVDTARLEATINNIEALAMEEAERGEDEDDSQEFTTQGVDGVDRTK